MSSVVLSIACTNCNSPLFFYNFKVLGISDYSMGRPLQFFLTETWERDFSFSLSLEFKPTVHVPHDSLWLWKSVPSFYTTLCMHKV